MRSVCTCSLHHTSAASNTPFFSLRCDLLYHHSPLLPSIFLSFGAESNTTPWICPPVNWIYLVMLTPRFPSLFSVIASLVSRSFNWFPFLPPGSEHWKTGGKFDYISCCCVCAGLFRSLSLCPSPSSLCLQLVAPKHNMLPDPAENAVCLQKNPCQSIFSFNSLQENAVIVLLICSSSSTSKDKSGMLLLKAPFIYYYWFYFIWT